MAAVQRRSAETAARFSRSGYAIGGQADLLYFPKMDTGFSRSVACQLRAQLTSARVRRPSRTMLDWNSLSSSSVLSTVRCTDPEQIVGLLPGTKRRLLPLTGNFKYFQASLQLEHIRLVIVQRPPCASEGYLEQDQTGIALSMANSPGLKLDGIELDQPALVTHGLTALHRIFQPSELTIAAVFMRDVPERTHAARVKSIRPGSRANRPTGGTSLSG